MTPRRENDYDHYENFGGRTDLLTTTLANIQRSLDLGQARLEEKMASGFDGMDKRLVKVEDRVNETASSVGQIELRLTRLEHDHENENSSVHLKMEQLEKDHASEIQKLRDEFLTQSEKEKDRKSALRIALISACSSGAVALVVALIAQLL